MSEMIMTFEAAITTNVIMHSNSKTLQFKSNAAEIHQIRHNASNAEAFA
jgi:hypothetical protein